MKNTGFLIVALMFTACTSAKTPEELQGKEGDIRCQPTSIPPPVDYQPETLPLLCIHASIDALSDKVQQSTDVSGDILFTKSCLDFDIPDNLQFVIGAQISEGFSGSDNQDLRLPLPSAIDIRDYAEVPPGASLPENIEIPDEQALLVGKLTRFKGVTYLKLVNIANIRSAGGQSYLETLTQVAQDNMSDYMRVDGPGVYALFLAKTPLAYISGRVSRDQAATPNALVISQDGTFLSLTNQQGQYTIAAAKGQGAIAAYDLDTGAHGEKVLPIEEAGSINPKTNELVQTPATQKALPDLDDLNLTGVDIDLNTPTASMTETNLNFESSNLGSWDLLGNGSVLSEKVASVFPDSPETYYAFLSTGSGALGGIASGLTRDFEIPDGVTKMGVEYNFVSQEYPGWVNSQYNDMFYILIGGERVFLHRETVNDNAGSWLDFYQTLGNVTESNASGNGVEQKFGGKVGTRTKIFDIARCSGQRTRVIFAVSDLGDTIYDTAALINRIWFE
ncbi:MAG TPA: choice-of-anchor L domain-containing protein [Oligoflexus sp.]|uniref:choice-of-anchor L domain-containing protein n=1 Tax=Oligoflexus sp. TaxID=1971216 RepID=UPI002D3B947A|nr:choice-of-anchor L domain-containing protein [Oligoflexus sp.]HYX38830.1 choice-of-anchor L domain-containing protein [Oligoflexus sp.]